MRHRALGVVDQVTKDVRDALDDIFQRPLRVHTAFRAVQRALASHVSASNIHGFSDLKVDVQRTSPLRQVGDLPPSAAPGDPLIRRHNVGDGIMREELEGIVVSSDGDGSGVVLAKPRDDDGEVHVSVNVQPNFPLEYIELRLVHKP